MVNLGPMDGVDGEGDDRHDVATGCLRRLLADGTREMVEFFNLLDCEYSARVGGKLSTFGVALLAELASCVRLFVGLSWWLLLLLHGWRLRLAAIRLPNSMLQFGEISNMADGRIVPKVREFGRRKFAHRTVVASNNTPWRSVNMEIRRWRRRRRRRLPARCPLRPNFPPGLTQTHKQAN